MDSLTESFPQYVPHTDETGEGFLVFVVLYTTLSFLMIAPLVIWGRKFQRERDAVALTSAGFYSRDNEFAAATEPYSTPRPQEEHPQHQQLHNNQDQPGTPFRDARIQQPIYAPPGPRAVAVRSIFRGIDGVSSKG